MCVGGTEWDGGGVLGPLVSLWQLLCRHLMTRSHHLLLKTPLPVEYNKPSFGNYITLVSASEIPV